MNIMVLGNDGYIGYPLTIHLLERGHTILGIDNLSRRARVAELGGDSLTPILSQYDRIKFLEANFGNFINQIDLTLGRDSVISLKNLTETFKPDAIIHLAEQPSAAWSMRSVFSATITQLENVIGTLHLLWVMQDVCPDAHLIKLGTMGEYGTPDCVIPEGKIPEICISENRDECDREQTCDMSGLLFPRTAGSFYHLSKVHDTHNIEFACRNWRLRATDIMQGIVFGLVKCSINAEDITRFDYDECFGTVINRFCVQAISDMPLTVYGTGNQTRGFIHLRDSIQCIDIALNNPPKKGEYRTFNQFESTHMIKDIAYIVCHEAANFGLNIAIKHLNNPRIEAEDHYYIPVHEKLHDLGFVPKTDIPVDINNLINQLIPYKNRVKLKVISPKIEWRQTHATT